MSKDGEFDFTAKTAHDWSCRNPSCCGGELARKARRRERAADKEAVRKDPEGAPTKQSTKGRKPLW